MARALTNKQENFCQAHIECGVGADAYRAAYDCSNKTDKTIHEAASRLLRNDKVLARIKELKALITEKYVWEQQDSLRVLSDIANGTDQQPKDRITAIKELNSMHGFKAAENHKHSFVGKDGKPMNLKVNVSFVAPDGGGE